MESETLYEKVKRENERLRKALEQIFDLCAHPPKFSIVAVADITIKALR